MSNVINLFGNTRAPEGSLAAALEDYESSAVGKAIIEDQEASEMAKIGKAMQDEANAAAFKEEKEIQAVLGDPEPAFPEVDQEVLKNYQGKASDFFRIEREPIFSAYGEIEDRKALFVNERKINIVSNEFEVHQPIDIMQRFANVSDSHGLEINRVLNNPNNGGILISAKYGQQEIMGEMHDINFTFYTANDSKYRTFLSMDLLRMACFNQIPTLYKNKDRFIISEKHYKNALDYDVIDEALINVPATIFAYEEKANLLKDKAFSMSDFIEFYIQSYNVDREAKLFDSKIRNLKDVYYNAKGQKQVGPNAFKAYQAITFINTHNVKKTAMVEENRLIKNGNDSLKQLERLLAVA